MQSDVEWNCSISIPDLDDVEVGTSATVTVTITNLEDVTVKNIAVGIDNPEVELFGVIPDMLLAGEPFDMQLTWTPREWNPDGMTGTIKATAVKVSR